MIEEILNLDTEIETDTLERYHSTITYYFYKEWAQQQTQSLLALLENMYNDEQINIILDKEAVRKELAFYSKIEKKLDGSVIKTHLVLGDDGEINGHIVAENNNVSVKTIIAGGHSIQIMHYRVLVKVIK
jgi:hypothetical protein